MRQHDVWLARKQRQSSCDSNIRHWLPTLAKGIDDIAEMYKYNIVLANSDEDGWKGKFLVVNTLFSKQSRWGCLYGLSLDWKRSVQNFRSRTIGCSCWYCRCRTINFLGVNTTTNRATIDAVSYLLKENERLLVEGPVRRYQWQGSFRSVT